MFQKESLKKHLLVPSDWFWWNFLWWTYIKNSVRPIWFYFSSDHQQGHFA